MRKSNVLFLCSANDARSQMGEALLRRRAGDRFDVFSAGLRASEVHPLTQRVMDEMGLDLAEHWSKGVDEFLGRIGFKHAIFVCRPGAEACPRTFPSAANRVYWPVLDPLTAACFATEPLRAFRETRDEIEARIGGWLTEVNSVAAGDLTHLVR